jgi:predicted secreted protein
MPAIKSFGVSVSVDGDVVGGLTDVSIPESDRTEIDVTNHDTTGDFREFVGGLKDGGTMTLSGHYIAGDAGQTNLASPADGDPVAVIVTFSDDSTATMEGVAKGYGVTNPLDDVVTFSASIKISGEVTFAGAPTPP